MANEDLNEKETEVTIESGVTGEVKIADDVVAVIAALAAQEVEGVGDMAGGIGKTIMAYVGMKKADKGVHVDVSDGVVRTDISITVKYGYSIPTGLRVADVNIRVAGVVTGEKAE